MSDDLATLVLRCRAGDRDAESALAHRAAARALQVAAVAMGDVHAARDVSQETAVRMLRGLGDLRAPDRFDAWVYRIADAMHCRPATVRSLLSRARKRLSRHPALADHATLAARTAPHRRTTDTRALAEESRP